MKKSLVIALFILFAAMMIGSAIKSVAEATQKYADRIAEAMPK